MINKKNITFRKTTSKNRLVRFSRFIYLKLMRQPGGPDSIAAGMALGIFLSLAIPAGGQIICIIILAFFFRFNRIIAIAATWLTNPWTIPLIYPLLVKFGSFITGFKISLKEMKSFINNLHNLDLSSVFDLGTEICLNFLVGGFFTGIILSGISYLATYKLLIRHREKKAERTKLRFNLRKKKYK